LVSGLGIVDALCLASLANSKSEARRSVTEGAANVNNVKVTSPDRILNESDLAGDYLILRIGKKRYGLLRFV
jgi:tyrosyl-tRNA synthetase